MSTATIDTTPRVWLGCMAHYNAGCLIGEWVDAIDAAGVTPEQLHAGSGRSHHGCEEIWAYDVEGMLVDREMSPHEATQQAERLEAVDEHLRPAFRAWAASGSHVVDSDGLPCTDEFEDRYCGEWGSFREYADDCVESTGKLRDVPEEIQRHFDHDSFARELRMDFTVVDSTTGGVFVFRDL